eukprot:g5509.t1
MTSWLGWGSSTEESPELTAEEEESQKIHSISELKIMCQKKCKLATNEEKDKIKDMRKLLVDDFENYPRDVNDESMRGIFGDFRMLRWLRSRDGDINEAVSAFRIQLKWRVDNGADDRRDQIIKKCPNLTSFLEYCKTVEILKYMPQSFCAGRTVDGHLVQYDFNGQYSLNEIDFNPDDVVNELDTLYEWIVYYCDEESRRMNKLIYMCRITDLDGLSIFKHFYPKLLNTVKAYVKGAQEHFAEHVCFVGFVNAPLLFRAIYAIARPVLNENTKKKVKVLGQHDDETVQEVLHEAIPKKYLHKKYGGDMKNIPGLHGFKLLSYVEEEEEPMADKV